MQLSEKFTTAACGLHPTPQNFQTVYKLFASLRRRFNEEKLSLQHLAGRRTAANRSDVADFDGVVARSDLFTYLRASTRSSRVRILGLIILQPCASLDVGPGSGSKEFYLRPSS